MRKTVKKKGGVPLKKLATLALLSGRSLSSAKPSHFPNSSISNRTNYKTESFLPIIKNRSLYDDFEIAQRDVPMGNEPEDIEIVVTELPSPRRIQSRISKDKNKILDNEDFEIIQSDVPMGNEKNEDMEIIVTELPSPRRLRKSTKRKKNKKRKGSKTKI
jgi:hypothetical protein